MYLRNDGKQKMEIIEFDGPLPPDVLEDVVALAVECGIDEVYDRACDLTYLWMDGNEIVAVIAFKKVLFTDGRLIPRWEHIFYRKSARPTKKAYYFLLTVEQKIVADGYNQMWAYVMKERQVMYDLAVKFGFKEYAKDNDGNYLLKNLTQKKRRF